MVKADNFFCMWVDNVSICKSIGGCRAYYPFGLCSFQLLNRLSKYLSWPFSEIGDAYAMCIRFGH